MQFKLRVYIVLCLNERNLTLLNQGIGSHKIGFGDNHFGVDFCNAFTGCFQRSLLFAVIEFEERFASFHLLVSRDIHFINTSTYFRKDGNGSKCSRYVRCRRMIIEDHRDQGNCEDEARSDPPPEFEPHGVDRDLVTDPFSLTIPAVKIIRKDSDH
ncbi:hypothetical protein D9M69_566370 [compost metagenome]